MRNTVKDGYKGLLFRNGCFVKVLNAGQKYFDWDDVALISLDKEAKTEDISVDTLMNYEKYREAVDCIEVKDNETALRFVDGNFDRLLDCGKHAFFKSGNNVEIRVFNTEDPYIGDKLPEYVIAAMPISAYKVCRVSEYEVARYYNNEKLIDVLKTGVYYFWRNSNVRFEIVDTRLIRLDVATQEILSGDKVSLRVNFTCSYRISDVVKIASVKDYEAQIYNCAQMAIREYIGKQKLDEILDNRDAMSDFVMERLKDKEGDFFVEFSDAGIKDIILPGDVRDIMNTVLLAEKKAQANVITRREEVASTRSLLNTAKLMEENPTLYKLKELEYVEKICENVGNITLNGNTDMLSQLMNVLSANK